MLSILRTPSAAMAGLDDPSPAVRDAAARALDRLAGGAAAAAAAAAAHAVADDDDADPDAGAGGGGGEEPEAAAAAAAAMAAMGEALRQLRHVDAAKRAAGVRALSILVRKRGGVCL
jgi:hypothetical protein